MLFEEMSQRGHYISEGECREPMFASYILYLHWYEVLANYAWILFVLIELFSLL